MRNLTEFSARRLLSECGVKLPCAYLAKSEAEAKKYAEKTGYPLVLKLMSADILHKSDAGTVSIVNSSADIHAAFSQIFKNAKKYKPDAKIDGVLVEEHLSGTELIIGAKKDAQFGHVIVFGLGGIFVEAIQDTAIRLAPLERKDAKAMVREIKGQKLLTGYRGRTAVNLSAVEDALLAISRLVARHPEIKELDINPLFADARGAVAGDARIIVG